jgi:type I restriction enzyme S subunit
MKSKSPSTPTTPAARLDAQIEECRRLRHQATEETEALVGSARRRWIGDAPSQDWLPLRTYVSEIENGSSPNCERRPAEDGEWGVLKVGAMSFGTFDPQENKAIPPTFRIDPHDEVRPGDFLMSRANTSELVGACVIVQKTPPRLVLSDKSFRFVFRPNHSVDHGYLNHVLKSPALRAQIVQQATGTSSTMKNISKEKVFSLLVPPHDSTEQQRIVGYLDGLAGQVAALARLQSETAAELDALLPSVLDKAFKGEL